MMEFFTIRRIRYGRIDRIIGYDQKGNVLASLEVEQAPSVSWYGVASDADCRRLRLHLQTVCMECEDGICESAG